MKELQVTSISQIKKDSSGEVVELPSFSAGTHFCARLRRPSMLSLVANGKIPNTLLVRTQEMFLGNSDEDGHREYDLEDESLMKDMYGVLEVVASVSFVEPSYKELVANDIALTDEQLMFVFNYVQAGVEQLDTFRTEQEGAERIDNVAHVPCAPVAGA